MPEPTVATIRRKKTPESPADSRRRRASKPPKASARSRLAARRFWPIAVIVVGVFLVAYILDWDSITTLMLDCLVGQFGLTASLASFGVLFLLGCGAALLWHRPIPKPAAKAPRKARRSPARPEKAERSEPEEAAPAATLPATGNVAEKTPRKPKMAR